MKTVTITKDAYIDNSVRVNYFDKNATRKQVRIKEGLFLGDSPDPEDTFEEVDVVYDNLLFCERLTWTNEEAELAPRIESKRTELESLI
jgi:hypothetical protein